MPTNPLTLSHRSQGWVKGVGYRLQLKTTELCTPGYELLSGESSYLDSGSLLEGIKSTLPFRPLWGWGVRKALYNGRAMKIKLPTSSFIEMSGKSSSTRYMGKVNSSKKGSV